MAEPTPRFGRPFDIVFPASIDPPQSFLPAPEAPHAAQFRAHDSLPGDLAYHGGPVIRGPFQVINIYIDSFTDDRNDFDAFSQAIVEGGFYISPDGQDTSSGVFVGSVQVQSGLSGVITDNQLGSLIDTLINNGTLPLFGTIPGLYCAILPATLQISRLGQVSCEQFCGYHEQTPLGRYINVIIDQSCPACHGVFSPSQARQAAYAHEYAEWRSDPQLTAWFNSTTGVEQVDECQQFAAAWGPANRWTVEPLWLNGQGCVVLPYQAPAPAITPPPASGGTTSTTSGLSRDLPAGPTIQIRDSVIVTRTRSLLDAGNTPVPEEITRDLLLEQWLASDLTGGVRPEIFVEGDLIQADLAKADWIQISAASLSRQYEGHRHEFINVETSLELSFKTTKSRQVLYNMQAECQRIIDKWILALVPYHSLYWDDFQADYSEARQYQGSAGVHFVQQGLPIFEQRNTGYESPATDPLSYATKTQILPS